MKKSFIFYPSKNPKFILNKVINKNKNFLEAFILKTKDPYRVAKKFFKIKVYTGRQVHKDTIKIVNKKNKKFLHKIKADAFITSTPEIAIGVRLADCVGSVIVDTKKKIIAVVHSGWRGIAKKIILKTIDKMKKMGSSVEDIIVSMSPAIGKCCYEIGKDVYNKLKKDKIFSNIFIMKNKKIFMDLHKANYTLLLKAKIKKKNIYINDLCTYCNKKLFFSFRREGGKTGRMIYFAVIRKEEKNAE